LGVTDSSGSETTPPETHPGLPKWLVVLLGVATVLVIVSVVVFALAVRSYKTFYIPGVANEPTLRPGDRIVVHKGHGHLHRGDVVVYEPVAPCAEARFQIKRVVAVPGDRVSSQSGELLVNGHPAPESYLPRDTTTVNVTNVTVPPRAVYVLGDNRNNSKDSRFCGPVPVGHVVGRAVLRVWPLSRFGGI
jgi:signal peptidase I